MPVEIVKADYNNEAHRRDLVMLLDAYARDPMGGGKPLDDQVKQALVPGLAARPDAFSFIAYVDGQPAGLINCFEGFSTFRAKPLINVHDVTVLPSFRGMGLAGQLLQSVEAVAHARGCCKMTLEVYKGNTPAQSAYRRHGFSAVRQDDSTGQACFWEKLL